MATARTWELHPDFSDLLAEFARCGVRFAVVGGYAVAHHGRPRATKDLDILVSGRADNLDRAATALAAFGAPGAVVDGVRRLEPSEIAYFGVPPLRIDIMRRADGIDSEEAIASADCVQHGDIWIPVIGLELLIANKRAAGRPQDLADVAFLERLRERRDSGRGGGRPLETPAVEKAKARR